MFNGNNVAFKNGPFDAFILIFYDASIILTGNLRQLQPCNCREL